MPGPRVALFGSLAWSAIMTASALMKLLLDGWSTPEHIAFVAAFFAAGGAVAFVPALVAARLVSGQRAETLFAATFLALAVATIAATAFLFSLQFRLYFASWHGAPLTIRWVFEYVFTTASAVYQFLVGGLRLYFPVGFVALLAAALWHARSMR